MPRAPKDFPVPRFPGMDVNEINYRKTEDEQEKALRLHKEKLLFYFKELPAYVFGFAFLGVSAFYCYWVLFTPSTSPEERRYAWSALSAVLGGIVGIVYGRSTK